jgi:hypothetical protein
MLAKHIKSVGIPPRKISSFLLQVKDDVEVRTLGVYIGQTVRSVETRIKEYHRHMRLGYPENRRWRNIDSTPG